MKLIEQHIKDELDHARGERDRWRNDEQGYQYWRGRYDSLSWTLRSLPFFREQIDLERRMEK